MTFESLKKSPKIWFLFLSSTVVRIFSGVLIGIMLLFILPLVLPYLDDANSFRYIRTAVIVEQGINSFVKENVPTKVGGKDMTRWFVIAGMFILSGTFSRTSERLHDRGEYLMYKLNVDDWKERMNLSDNAIVLSPLNQDRKSVV